MKKLILALMLVTSTVYPQTDQIRLKKLLIGSGYITSGAVDGDLTFSSNTSTFTGKIVLVDPAQGTTTLQQGTNISVGTGTYGAQFNSIGNTTYGSVGVRAQAQVVAGSKTAIGVYGLVWPNGLGSYTGQISGGAFRAQSYRPDHVGGGTLTKLTGSYSQVIMGYDGTETVTDAEGVNSSLYMDAGGTIGTFKAFYNRGNLVTSGTITNYHGFYFQRPTTATITNEYGIYVEAPGLGSSIREGIHNEGTMKQVGAATFTAAPILSSSSTPASNAACTAGTITWDASYLYLCTASGAWKRSPLTGY
jgi:hypothetical protein